MSDKAQANRQLRDAFELFNETSEQLQVSYQALQDKVATLTRELYAARSERLKQLTEKEQLAERLSTLLQALPGGVVVLNQRGYVSDCNTAAEQLLGQRLMGKRWSEIAAVGTLPARSASQEITLGDGRIVTVSRRTLETDGGAVLLLLDVTRTRSLAAQVARQERLSAMGEMMARLAHQVRTPLATALLYAGHLRKPQISPQQRDDFANRIQTGLHQLDRMLNDMLVFSGGARAGDSHISAVDLLAEVESTLAPRLQAVNAQWRVIADADVLGVCVNQASMASAFSNLVDNALQAGGEPVRLTWRVRRSGDRVQITLQDNGCGIPPEISDRIFEPFFTTRGNGTGLGLAVVRAVIEANQGSILLDQEPGQGARFVISLPFAESIEQLPSSRSEPFDTRLARAGGRS
jgi:two-component system sensor histidine kinase FlrB